MIEASPDLQLVYGLAVKLGRWPSEVMDRPLAEIRMLAAFLDWQEDRRRETERG